MRDVLQSGGVGHPSVSWKGAPVGAAIEGIAMPQWDEEKGRESGYLSVPQTDMEGNVKTWADGSERPQAQIILLTAFRNREALSLAFTAANPQFEDDGYRACHMPGKEELLDLRRGVGALGGDIVPGTYVRWALIELKPNTKGAEPIKIRSVQLRQPDAASLAAVAAYRAAHPRLAAAPKPDVIAGGWGQQPAAQPGWGQQAPQGPPSQQPAWGAPPPQQPAAQPGWGQQAPHQQPQGPSPAQPGWGAPPPQGPPSQQNWAQPQAEAPQGPPPQPAAPADPWAQSPPAQPGWGQQPTPGAEPPF
jgi:hypothetical protein